jgi:hypothetical protein
MERVRELAQHYNEDAVIGNFTNKPPKKQKITKAKMRNVEWIHYHKYTQVKAGIPMETEAQIKLLFENKEINKELSAKWPNITVKKPPLPEAENYKYEKNKFEKYIL